VIVPFMLSVTGIIQLMYSRLCRAVLFFREIASNVEHAKQLVERRAEYWSDSIIDLKESGLEITASVNNQIS
jgi:hypothetical protein